MIEENGICYYLINESVSVVNGTKKLHTALTPVNSNKTIIINSFVTIENKLYYVDEISLYDIFLIQMLNI